MSNKSRSSGFGWFLIPGILASVAVIVVPLVMTVGISFTRWTGIGDPEWIGFDNYTRLFHDEQFWASFGHILLLILAMAVVPTLLGLLLAAVLFDYVGKVFGDRWAGFFRSGLYLPQVLPVAVTGIVWGWILHPDYGALNKILDAIGLHRLAVNWLRRPKDPAQQDPRRDRAAQAGRELARRSEVRALQRHGDHGLDPARLPDRDVHVRPA